MIEEMLLLEKLVQIDLVCKVACWATRLGNHSGTVENLRETQSLQ